MDCPKDSEVSIGEWLDQIGARKRFVGGCGEGPPDWEIQYRGDKIGVEVTLLHDTEGWGKTREEAFARELRRLIEEESKERGQKWYASCEYDRREPRPPSKEDGAWKERVRDALGSPSGGEFQLLAEEDMRGRGVVLELVPVTNEGFFAGVSTDEGCAVEAALTEQVVAGVREKVKKIRKGKRAACYRQWWLVFDDEIGIAPIVTILNADERGRIQARVEECQETVQLSKVVLVSRFQFTPPSENRNKWFYAPWEDPRNPPLPASPYSDTTA